MEENEQDILSNEFLTRGCCMAPSVYGHNKKDVYKRSCAKLSTHNWLDHIEPPMGLQVFDCVEIRFKNSRKDFYRINTDYEVNEGDIVAVEASPGHDIGIVTLTGDAARLQMKKKRVNPKSELKRVYRKARATDIEKWITSIEHEEDAMHKSRKAAEDLRLDMKISDIEYQGDGTKAIFYYTAEERVDFRELIKVLAGLFKVRIEMRQIGVRQEASRLGGIGSCGRELCCCTWLTNFKSVTTQAARAQQLALNPQKLAGQCSKLKCCINFEYDVYIEAQHDFPDPKIILETKQGKAFYQKSDVFKQIIWYAYENENSMMAIPVNKVKEIIRMNSKGKRPDRLEDFSNVQERKLDFENAIDQSDLDRFDK